MNSFLFKLITLTVACFAISQNAIAQWTGTPNPTTPTIIYNNQPTVSKVGIGTTNPATKLNVSTASSNDGIRVNQTGTTAASLSLQAGGAGGKNWALFSTGPGNSQGAGHLTFYDWTVGIERMRISTDGAVMMHGYNATVGAGLTKLGLGNAGGAALGYGTSYLGFNAFRSQTGSWTIDNDGANSGGSVIWGDVGGGIRFATVTTTGASTQTLADGTILAKTKMHIAGDGKVGIGIDPGNCGTFPSFPTGYRLYVKDGILTEKLKVANYCTANWADYVFEPDYKLKPLAEVETFVKVNKHLPNVPSAQDIENNGLDVADMLSRQMAKIEELTLYLIEMKQEIKVLKEENNSLKTAISKR